MTGRLRRLPYWAAHIAVALALSAAGLSVAGPWGWSAGAVFYALREVNQWAAWGRYDWPDGLTWLLGRPAPRFNWPGLIAPVAAVALGAVFVAAPARAEPMPARIEGLFGGGDRIIVEQMTAAIWRLTYTNSAAENSNSGDGTLQLDQLIVDFSVRFGQGEAERIIVEPRGGYIAIPDWLDVLDGQSAVITIAPAMF